MAFKFKHYNAFDMFLTTNVLIDRREISAKIHLNAVQVEKLCYYQHPFFFYLQINTHIPLVTLK